MQTLASTLPTVALAAAVLAAPAGAQDSPLLIEVRGGGGFPVGTFVEGPSGRGDLDPGASLGVHFLLPRGDHLTVYAGFSQVRFGCTEDGCPGEGEYVSTGWELGARWNFAGGGVAPWLSLGVLLPRVEGEFRGAAGQPVDRTSELRVGGEAGLGLRIRIAERFHLDPGVRLSAANTPFPDGPLLQMRYVTVELGLQLGF